MVLTAGLFGIHYCLPEKRLVLWPTDVGVADLYGYADKEQGKSAYWLNETASHWTCHYKRSNDYGCGWSVQLAEITDFSTFDALEIQMEYHGPAARLRIFLRNHNPQYTLPNDPTSSKVMAMSVPAAQAEHPLRISLEEFSVSSWWLLERKTNQKWTQPEFDSITSLGVDLVEPGTHQVRIDRITLVGDWFKTETLLIAILSFWISVYLLEGLVRFFFLYRTTQRNRHEIRAMEDRQRALERENLQLEVAGNTDPLTGVYNRAGLQSRLDILANLPGSLAGLHVMLMDIDHFKQLNDRFGHDMGDKVLKTFASLVSMNLRDDDVFARLGGEEFVVIARTQAPDGSRAFAQKLRQLALHCTFNGDSKLNISISIGVTTIGQHEDLAAALKRADSALYKAKENGRNRVEYEPCV